MIVSWMPGIGAAESMSIDYSRDIQPILAKKCYACHGPDEAESGLRFDTFEAATAEADSGLQAIVAGNAEESELLVRIASNETYDQMPPEGQRLSEREQRLLRTWIEQGAEFTPHWAFQPMTNPSIPEVADSPSGLHDFVQNPIDRFVLARLEENGLSPAKATTDSAWLTRTYFAVTGLPPTLAQQRHFAADPSPDRYDRVADRLLADPGFGERWARHWMDVVRYAETNSFERDGAKPNAWKYRDYVIRSMNDDKPFDTFVREQIAGDELDDVTTDSLIATGYYRLGIWDDEPADALQATYDEYDDLVSTTSQAFMALTINCARCHDHKIDPIPQKDYYKMVAFLRDVNRYGTRGDQKSNNQINLAPESVQSEYQDISERLKLVRRDRRTLEQKGIESMSGEDQRKTEGSERGETLKSELQKHLSDVDWKHYVALGEELDALALRQQKLPPVAMALGLGRCDPQPEETFLLTRGIPQAPAEKVDPGFPAIFGMEPIDPSSIVATDRSAGRRRVLADWMVSESNFLTARVAVNRIWQHYFGRGIVRSTNNFGLLGNSPTHPALLDFLARELIRQDWQPKFLHRLILTSGTFRMASRSDNALAMEIDPANDLFWRFNARRLSAEEIRDRVLTVSGSLNLDRQGKSIFPNVAAEVMQSQSRPGDGWSTSAADQQARRSVYIHIKRSLIPPELSVFDFPETDISCEARFLTTQPSQALGMINGDFLQKQSGQLAERILEQVKNDASIKADLSIEEQQVEAAIEQIYSRPATDFDRQHAENFRAKMTERYALEPQQVFEMYCLVLLNANEFVYVD
jgi:hypothetical protein